MYGNTQYFNGWVTSTTTTPVTSQTYYTNYYNYNDPFAYVQVYPSPKKPVKKEPEPEPCTDEELEEFLFGGT